MTIRRGERIDGVNPLLEAIVVGSEWDTVSLQHIQPRSVYPCFGFNCAYAWV